MIKYLLFITISISASAFAIKNQITDKIPEDVMASEISSCIKSAPKKPEWSGPLYCNCVLKEAQKTISYTEYKGISKELELPPEQRAKNRSYFDAARTRMENATKVCLIEVSKREELESKQNPKNIK